MIKTIKTFQITVPEYRQRKRVDEDRIKALAASITSPKGLLKPIVLRDDEGTLVAGYRRLTAITNHIDQPYWFGAYKMAPDEVPYLTLRDLPGDEIFEAELHENLLAEKLTWQEEVQAKAELHEMRKRDNPAQTYKDTASEIQAIKEKGQAEGSKLESLVTGDAPVKPPEKDGSLQWEAENVADSVMLRALLDQGDPDIQKAKSQKEAVRLARRKVGNAMRRQLAEQVNLEEGTSRHTLHNCKCHEGFPTVEAGSVDCLIADPPYGIEATTFKGPSYEGASRHQYDDSYEAFEEITRQIVHASSRICKPDAHIYIFCDISNWHTICQWLDEAGWTSWKWPIIWDKCNAHMSSSYDRGPMHRYEAIAYAYRGNRLVRVRGDDVLRHSGSFEKSIAPEKPAALYRELLSRSCDPGDTVLDPCCGSGPIFPAADELGLYAIGFEPDVEHHGLALSRLQEV